MSLFLYYSENESMTYEAFLKLLRNEIVISIGIFSVVWLMLRKQIKETFYGSPKKQ
jgi:fumarate reductase subunit C